MLFGCFLHEFYLKIGTIIGIFVTEKWLYIMYIKPINHQIIQSMFRLQTSQLF
jgi:uncharacterized protein YneF (UPF0154 family)